MTARRRGLFVVGAGTEIGKTFVTAALTRRLHAGGYPVRALKPLASGVPPIDDPSFSECDTVRLLVAQSLPVNAQTVEACSPWRFRAALAPNQAAALEDRRLSLQELVAWCERQLEATHLPEANPHPHPEVPRSGFEGGFQGSQRLPEVSFEARMRRAPQDEGGDGIDVAAAPSPVILIEGVGGVMSPVTDRATGLDWLKALDLPALLVSGSYLGAISHALTAAETLKAHAVPLAAIVVSESAEAPTPPEVVAAAIARHTAAPVSVLPRNGEVSDALAQVVASLWGRSRDDADSRPDL